MRWLLAAVVLLALFEPAFAAKPVSCLDVEAEAEARIAACTSALEANKTAEAYVDRATAYDSYARWHEALADLDKALALDPKHMVALKLRAIAHEIMGNRSRALEDLDRAIALDPSAELYVMRAGLLETHDNQRHHVSGLLSDAEVKEVLNKNALARDDHDRAVDAAPDAAFVYLARGRFFAKEMRLTQAVCDFSAAIARDPNELEAYRERANAYILQNKYDAALADLSRVLAARPKDLDALRTRRTVYLWMGNASRAIADAEALFAVAEYVNVSDHLDRGLAYLRRGGEPALARAEADFARAAQLRRGKPSLQEFMRVLCRTLCFSRRGSSLARLLLAVAPSAEKLDQNRRIADADAHMGILAFKRGNKPQAAQIFAAALGTSKDASVAHYGLGVLKFEAGDVEGAKDDFARARLIGVDADRVYANAGIEPVPAIRSVIIEPPPDAGIERDVAMCQNGNDLAQGPGGEIDVAPITGACTRVARSQLPKEARAMAYVNRAKWRAMGGDRTRAAEDLAAALTLDPNNVDALIAKASVAAGARKFAEARDLFDRAATVNPKSFHAVFGRCEMLAELGELKAAVADCDRAIALSGQPERFGVRRAPVLLRAGEYARALADYDLVLREDARYGLPENPYARFGRAVALKRLGNTVGADSDLKLARAQVPGIDREFAALGIRP